MQTQPCEEKKILLTIPALHGQGGVAGFYNGILPHFPQQTIFPLEIGGARKSGGWLHPISDQFRFRSAIKTVKPTLIHLNPSLGPKSFVRDGLFAWQAKQQGIPLLVFWHGWNKNFESTVEKFFLGYFRRTFGKADGFIVLASEFERTLRDWGCHCPVFRETTNVDQNLTAGINVLEKWQKAAQSPQTKILFLARLERDKGVFETIKAVRILIDRLPDVRLTIAGDGKIRTELEKYSRSLGLSPQQVLFTGHIEGKEKIRVFSEHHIYCFPTFYGEGLPTSVLEAMSFGMPVVTRPAGGLADVFEDGRMGALVFGKSPEEIAACLENLLSDRDRMAEIGRYNAEYAKEHFMSSVVAKRLLTIYESL